MSLPIRRLVTSPVTSPVTLPNTPPITLPERIVPAGIGEVLSAAVERFRRLPHLPLIVALLALAAALMSSFVLVVHSASERGDALREHQRLTGRYDASWLQPTAQRPARPVVPAMR